MKKFVFITVIVMSLFMMGCDNKKENINSHFEISYNVEKVQYYKGDVIEINVKVLNTGDDYQCNGDVSSLFGEAVLIDFDDNKIVSDDFESESKMSENVLKSGESINFKYTFTTSENDSEGHFSMAFSFANDNTEFYRIIYLTDQLSDEEKRLKEIAEEKIMSSYPIENFNSYVIDINFQNNGNIKVTFDLEFFGYSTRESYSVEMTSDGHIEDVYGEFGKYFCYLSKVTSEDMAKASRSLDKQTSYTDKKIYYLTIDSEDYLCLSAEVIVLKKFHLPFAEDHEHKFYSERIVQK